MKRIVCILLLLTLLCGHGFSLGYEGVKPGLGTQINWGDPLARGLIGCWLMNEGSGNKAYDLSGNNYNGAFSGDLSWSSGKFGPCLYSSDGYRRFVNTGAAIARRLGTACTNVSVSIWCKESVAGANNGLFHIGVTSTTGISFFGIEDNSGVFSLYINQVTADTTTTISLNVWHHVVATYDGISAKLYVDGVLKINYAYTTPIPFDPTGHFTQLGNCGHQNNSWRGWWENVQVWNRALSDAEVQQLYMTPFRIFQPSFDMKLYGALAAPPAAVGQLIFIQEDED